MSSFTLLIAIGIQTLILTIYILFKDIKQFYLLYAKYYLDMVFIQLDRNIKICFT